jgi:SAM-dependent methyltransferase
MCHIFSVAAVHAFAEAGPFPDGTFDAIVAWLAPHHFPDAAKAVRERARLTRAGGGVAVIDLEGDADRFEPRNRSAPRGLACPEPYGRPVAGVF